MILFIAAMPSPYPPPSAALRLADYVKMFDVVTPADYL